MNARFRWILPALMLGLAACQPRADADGAGDAPAVEEPARTAAGEEVFYHLFQRSFRDGDGDGWR